MAILSQSLLTLVSSHLVALFLFSVWHNFNYLNVKDKTLLVFDLGILALHLGYEALGRLEAGEVVSADDDGGVL